MKDKIYYTPQQIKDILGANLKHTRLKKYWENKVLLCKKLGITRQMLFETEEGVTFPRPESIAIFCNFFQVPLKELFEEDDLLTPQP